MHNNVYKEMNNITDSLDNELLQAHIIDKNGKVIKETEFRKILDKKIEELSKLEPLVSNEMGVVTDREAARDLFHRISELEKMRDNLSLDPEKDETERKMMETEQKMVTRTGFFDAISKLFKKTRPTANKEHSR